MDVDDSHPPDGGGNSGSNPHYINESDNDGCDEEMVRQSIVNFSNENNINYDNSQTHKGNINSNNITTNSNKKSQVKNSPETRTGQYFKESYSITDNAPFIVYIENKQQNIGKLHPMSIGKLIFDHHPAINDKIKNISSIGMNKIKIEFNDVFSANSILKSTYLKQNNEIYIPQYLTRRKGIIRDIPKDFSNEFLISNIQILNNNTFFTGNRVKVLEAQRLKRRVNQGEGYSPTFVDTQSVVISFSGNVLPKAVRIFGVQCSVEPFIQKVLQCRKCLYFGHTAKACRGNYRCNRCGDKHSTDECTSNDPPTCIHCKGPHNSSDLKSCPEFTRQKKIKEIMGTQNISYRDATKICDNKSYSTIVQNIPSSNDFPTLPNKQTNTQTENPHSPISPTPKRQRKSYLNRPIFEEEITNQPSTPYNFHNRNRIPRNVEIDSEVKALLETFVIHMTKTLENKFNLTKNQVEDISSECLSLVNTNTILSSLNKIKNTNKNGPSNSTVER